MRHASPDIFLNRIRGHVVEQAEFHAVFLERHGDLLDDAAGDNAFVRNHKRSNAAQLGERGAQLRNRARAEDDFGGE